MHKFNLNVKNLRKSKALIYNRKRNFQVNFYTHHQKLIKGIPYIYGYIGFVIQHVCMYSGLSI